MPKPLTRRQFLEAGLAFGASAGLGLSDLKHLSSPSPEPERTQSMRLELTGAIRPVHDPTIIKDGDRYFIFCTGASIPVRKSRDLIDWKMDLPPVVIAGVPDWIREKVPGQNDIWAPDISYYNDRFHLYYAVSFFGQNRSVIGLLTNKTLHFGTDDFKWVDEGLVLESFATDNYNCIDPNLIVDADGVPWLAFGSFWTGIKMRRLDLATGKPSEEDTTLYSLAQRTVNNGAIEAPCIIRKNNFYYLFASFDFCCKGVDSTYYVAVGRSESVTGPYVDRDGVPMLEGGGTQVTFPTERWRGPGHCSILQENDVDYMAYHAYDAQYQGSPTLQIAPLTWDDDGWPSTPPEA